MLSGVAPPPAPTAVASVRRLSGPSTFLYKVAIPAIWIATIFVLSATHFLLDTPQDITLLAIFSLVGTVVFFRYFVPLKQVSLEGNTLLVSNLRREIRVELADLTRATGTLGGRFEFVRLHFRHNTAFGSSILMMPPHRFTFGFTRHPLVAELNALAKAVSHLKG